MTLKLGQGISLIFEKAQTSAEIFAKLVNSTANEQVEGRAQRGCWVWALEESWCGSARSGGLRWAGSGTEQRCAARHWKWQKCIYWKLFLLFQGDYLVLKNRLEPVQIGEVCCGALGSQAAGTDAWPRCRAVLLVPVPQLSRGAGTPGTPAGTVPPGGVSGGWPCAPWAEATSWGSPSLRVTAAGHICR